MPLTETKITLGDVELTYYRGGRGRTLVYLHGGNGTRGKGRFFDLLAENFDVIAPVHPGFEQSHMPGWMDSVDDYAHLYVAFLDKLGCNNVLLAGSSLGGWIASEVVTKNSSRISQLTLIAPVGVKLGPIDRLDIPDIFAMREEPLRKLTYHDPDKWRFDATTASDETLTAIARNRETLALVTWEPYMHNPKLRHRLANVDIPTLLLRGESDGIVSRDYVEAYRRLFRSAALEVIAGAGHMPHLEQPDALCAAIFKFAKTAKESRS